ncbi:hypothetical protein TWF102_008526 [Orbilia oligospora]|uniref:Uncharacterized protein n=1 Tax=Orbilia oligospora TaxID=2813651 RepID=A0A7C8JBM3_ORBOL|nr:hypothetical protein TWF103_003427 [Orbilia oligospora]KAF3092117.1 hypothetical protein TWF102_008526 [Orbilia oligospora]
MPTAIKLGFGIEIESKIRPKVPSDYDYKHLFATLLSSDGLPASAATATATATGTSKYPTDYHKWWITSDGSIRCSRSDSVIGLTLHGVVSPLGTSMQVNGGRKWRSSGLDLLHKRATYRAVKNGKRSEVQEFWDKFLSYAERLGVRDDLLGEFKMMSEKESWSSEDWPTYLFVGASTEEGTWSYPGPKSDYPLKEPKILVSYPTPTVRIETIAILEVENSRWGDPSISVSLSFSYFSYFSYFSSSSPSSSISSNQLPLFLPSTALSNWLSLLFSPLFLLFLLPLSLFLPLSLSLLSL